MPDLDHRQLEILDKMGIDIWRLRHRQSGENAAQADNPADDRIDDAQTDGKSAEPLIQPKSAIALERQPELTVDALNTLDNVAMEINQCQRCPLHATPD